MQIKHILVLATPVEIVILALMFEGGDVKKELKIMPSTLPLRTFRSPEIVFF
jgi:hypothetical protein